MARKAFLTPPNMPSETVCRTLQIPDHMLWLGIFNSAILETIYSYNFEQVNETDLTPEETAAICYEILMGYFNSTGCATNVPIPFWDEASDTDDEMPADAQIWYGEVTDALAPPDELTFVENAAIWAFTGFIAYSGQVGAAIYFNTIAPSFVLSLKRGDLTGVIRVIVDAVQYEEVDMATIGEGEIIDIPILTDSGLSSHDILLVRKE